MNSDRVQHIIVNTFDEGYGETLCGRYVPVHIIGVPYGSPNYFKEEHPDCQDCLRSHFKDKKRNHK
jgi:hypothetical protein